MNWLPVGLMPADLILTPEIFQLSKKFPSHSDRPLSLLTPVLRNRRCHQPAIVSFSRDSGKLGLVDNRTQRKTGCDIGHALHPGQSVTYSSLNSLDGHSSHNVEEYAHTYYQVLQWYQESQFP